MSHKGGDHEVSFGNLLEDIPTMDDIPLEGGFFAGVDRGEWIRNLEHHFRYGEELLMLWGEPGVGKSTLLTQLASRLAPEVYSVVTLDARRGGSAEHLWGALDKRLSLPSGAEGWEALKRTAKKLASSGQSLAIIIDHADKLHKEAVQLLRAMLDVHLPECRFVLALDGTGTTTHGQWPAIEAQLFERGQLARLWPFVDEDALAYVDFRLQHAHLGDVVLTDNQRQTIVERSTGNAGLIRTELQRLLATGALVSGQPIKSNKPNKKTALSALKKGTAKSGGTPAAAAAKKPASTKKPFVLPKAHTVALSVLAVALLGFYFVWEKPVPSSVISTPSPTAQGLPPVIKTEETALPLLSEMEDDPPASGGLPSPIKTTLDAPDTNAEQPGVKAPTEKVTGIGPLSSQPHMQPPAGFVPSNVPLMATQGTSTKSSDRSAEKEQNVESAGSTSLPPANTKVSKARPTTTNRVAEPAMVNDAPPPSPAKSVAKAPAVKPVSAASAKKMPSAPKAAPKPVMVAKATPPVASAKQGGAYTLQIMGLRDLRSVQAVMQRNVGVKGLRYHTTTLNGEPWYVIVQGEYASRQAAQAAVKSLPAALQASKPFPKNISALQGATP